MRIEKEFKELIPPLSDEEFQELEKSCCEYGIRDSLVVCVYPGSDGEVLIDGHNRHEIARKCNLSFTTKRLDFSSKEAAMIWMINNQIGRRNLTAYQRAVLAFKTKPMLEKQAKENQKRTAENRVCQKSDEQKIDTKKELAKIAGVSHDTIHKVQVIEKKAPEAVRDAARKGDMSINEAYKRTVDKIVKPRDVVKEAKERHEQFKEAKQENVISFQDAKQDEDDRSLLSIDLYQEICKAVHGFDKLTLLRDDEQIADLFDSMETSNYNDLQSRLSRCYRTILWLQRMIEERRTNG